MRFIVMHKQTEELEKGLAPDPAVVEGVGKLIQEGLREKVFVSGEGLHPSSERLHIAYADGKRTVTEGPFREPKELIGGFTLLRVREKAEAIAWCDKLGAVLGNLELYLGLVVEPWDLGMMEKPKNPPQRFLAVHQLNEAAGAAEHTPELGALMEEMKSAGVLQASGGLAGTELGARVHFEGRKRSVIDGPFAESKELIAGYAIVDLPSKAAAIDWALRFGEIVKVNEIEVRQMSGS